MTPRARPAHDTPDCSIQTADEHIEEHIAVKDAKLTRTHGNWEALKAFAESLSS